jgi:hypothetical protein
VTDNSALLIGEDCLSIADRSKIGDIRAEVAACGIAIYSQSRNRTLSERLIVLTDVLSCLDAITASLLSPASSPGSGGRMPLQICRASYEGSNPSPATTCTNGPLTSENSSAGRWLSVRLCPSVGVRWRLFVGHGESGRGDRASLHGYDVC